MDRVSMSGLAKEAEGGVKTELTEVEATSITKRVLEIVRQSMPCDLIFTPANKIDFPLFLENQKFILNVAQHLLPFVDKKGDLSVADLKAESITKWFDGMFKKDQEVHIANFYACCLEAISNLEGDSQLQNAIQGRIFTVKNALVAQNTPRAIRLSQQKNKVAVQTESMVVSAGKEFLIATLRVYINHLKGKEAMPFAEQLHHVANQMAPFLKAVTREYLKEWDKEVPPNPLTFRNPTGYNCHGKTSASLMKVCLEVLGYQTKIYEKGDLELRVTITSRHALVVVTDESGKEYIVDPAYTQFFEDLASGASRGLKCEVLVIAKEDVSDYVENEIMSVWKENYGQILQKNPEALRRHIQNKSALQYMIDSVVNVPIPKWITSDVEGWASNAYHRIWDVDQYCEIFLDKTFEEIFVEGVEGESKKTHALVKGMNLIPMLSWKPESYYKAQLNVMQGLGKKHVAAVRALEAMRHLPKKIRSDFRELFEADPRISVDAHLSGVVNAYFHYLHSIVNPENKPKTLLYGCSGADVSSPFYSTNPNEVIFVDLTKVSSREFKSAFNSITKSSVSLKEVITKLQGENYFVYQNFFSGSQSVQHVDGKHEMLDLELKVMLGLRNMQVDMTSVKVLDQKDVGSVELTFNWKHHTDKRAKKRKITFINADIVDAANYPPALKKVLKVGIDIFYMKASFYAPFAYSDFVPTIGASLRKDGHFLSTDRTIQGISVDPVEHLKAGGGKYETIETNEMKLYLQCMKNEFHALSVISALKRERRFRTPGTNAEYWTMTNVRHKVG